MLEGRFTGLAHARRAHGDRADEVASWFEVGDPEWPLDDAPPRVPPPAWLEPERCDRGGLVLRRHGLLAAAVLRSYSLPLSYLSRVGVKPLVMTGHLLEDAAGRLYRTADYVLATQRWGAMHHDGDGWTGAATIRTVHQRVRHRLRLLGWPSELGAPLPQPDVAATALLFGPILVRGLRRLGAAISDEEADDVAHLSRAMAHGQGVVEALQADRHRDALRLFDALTSLNQPPGRDGRRLMASLLSIPHQLAVEPWDRAVAPAIEAFHRSLAVELLGRDDARALGLRGEGRLARAVAKLVPPMVHHRALAPIHDAIAARVLARGKRRLARRAQLAKVHGARRITRRGARDPALRGRA